MTAEEAKQVDLTVCRKCKKEMDRVVVTTSATMRSKYVGNGYSGPSGGNGCSVPEQYIETSSKEFYHCTNEECEHFGLLKIKIPRSSL